MLFKVFFISLFLYLLIRFLLNFLFPFLRFRKKAKQEWSRIMDQQNSYNNTYTRNQNNQSTAKEKPKNTIEGEYIDFEEL